MENTMDKVVEEIVAEEWKAFQAVNEADQRVDCQKDYKTFSMMRKAQFSAWPAQAASSYLDDLRRADENGRNLLEEKYIHMMKYSTPEQYAKLIQRVVLPTPEQEALTNELMDILLRQTRQLHKQYPLVSGAGRPVTSQEDGEDISFETYQRGELYTYSQQTLQALLDYVRALEKDGYSYSATLLENSVLCYGYASLDEAEAAVKQQTQDDFCLEMNTNGCCNCYCADE